jgi:hypothetical protein
MTVFPVTLNPLTTPAVHRIVPPQKTSYLKHCISLARKIL